MKVSLITGITGQDGSYLAELLLDKNYFVWGIIRRASNINTQRIEHLYENQNLILRYGDLTDSSNLLHILYEIKETYPDMEIFEIYNLGAMSHVKVSFEMPEYCANVDGTGTLRLLEAIRSSGLIDKTRFYQASTSELFGLVQEVPQKETTPFYPRSPYGVAKLYAYWIVKNYREAYNMFACNGILFNHETLAGFMPLIFKHNDMIDIKPISEIVKYHTLKNGILVDDSKQSYQEGFVKTDLQVWDNNDWTKVKFASGYPHDILNNNKKPRFIISKNSAYFTTSDHVIIMDDNTEIKTKDIKLGDKVKHINFPEINHNQKYKFKKKTRNKLECKYCNYVLSRIDHFKDHIKKCESKKEFLTFEINEDEAELLGLFVGDGNVSSGPRFTNKSLELINYVIKLWEIVCKRNNRESNHRLNQINSGFNKNVKINQIDLSGFNDFFRKYNIYNEDKTKRIPQQILNSDKNIKLKFLEGYNKADGLKSNKCIYQFKNFKTNSACLAQGLIFLIKEITKQEFNINIEFVNRHGKQRMYYSINLLSDTKYSLSKSYEKYEKVLELLKKDYSQRKINRETGITRTFIRKVQNNYIPSGKHHKSINSNIVKKIIDYHDYNGWFYDLETESGTFHAGIGLGRIHNSPRRGPTFVTRKITRGLNMILKGERDKLVLGNLDAKRDWGHAKDFVKGMYLILQQDKPDDFVLSTNEYHSVREFVERAFALKGFNIKWKGSGLNEIGYDDNTGKELIFVSDKYYRPAEVEELLGDSTKARTELGWELEYSFQMLIEDMVNSDCS